MSTIKLVRTEGPIWEFEWNDKYRGYIYSTKNNTYRIFFDNCTEKSEYNFGPDIWIGRLAETKDGPIWFTCEKAIKAQTLIMFRGQYNFR